MLRLPCFYTSRFHTHIYILYRYTYVYVCKKNKDYVILLDPLGCAHAHPIAMPMSGILFAYDYVLISICTCYFKLQNLFWVQNLTDKVKVWKWTVQLIRVILKQFSVEKNNFRISWERTLTSRFVGFQGLTVYPFLIYT